ncbi:MAG: OmpA family protein, partial [bacterium]|nr:OmpA family protein [bacterium]
VPRHPAPTPAPAPAATPTPAPPPAPAASQSAVPATGGDETRPGNPAAWGEDARALVGRTFAPIYFEFDSAELDSIARRQLAEYAQWLREHPNVWLTLEGHTDSTGSVRYNYNLGMARALAVEDYLRGAGVGADRMFCISYGEERPAVTGADPQSMALNRRTEVLGFVAPLGVEKPAPVAVTGGAAPQAAPAPAPPLAQDIPREPGR